METPYIGRRVKLVSLLHKGEFPGTIINTLPFLNVCDVKLDCQDVPVADVLYFDKEPHGEIATQRFQMCWSEENIKMDKALELWKRLFEEIPTPYYHDDFGGEICFFCDKSSVAEHTEDCIWIEAKKLVEESKE